MVLPIGALNQIERMAEGRRWQYESDVERYSAKSREIGTEMLAAHIAVYESSKLRRIANYIFGDGKEPPRIQAHRRELERRGIKTN